MDRWTKFHSVKHRQLQSADRGSWPWSRPLLKIKILWRNEFTVLSASVPKLAARIQVMNLCWLATNLILHFRVAQYGRIARRPLPSAIRRSDPTRTQLTTDQLWRQRRTGACRVDYFIDRKPTKDAPFIGPNREAHERVLKKSNSPNSSVVFLYNGRDESWQSIIIQPTRERDTKGKIMRRCTMLNVVKYETSLPWLEFVTFFTNPLNWNPGARRRGKIGVNIPSNSTADEWPIPFRVMEVQCWHL